MRSECSCSCWSRRSGKHCDSACSCFGAEVYSTVSSEKSAIVKDLGATPIDYRSLSVEEYVAAHGSGEGFDIVFDTVGGATLDASFVAVKRYTAMW